MSLPKYLVKWPAEAGWIAWLTALAGLTTVILRAFNVDGQIIAAVDVLIVATGRMITGAVLPTPTQAEAVAAVKVTTAPSPPTV